MQIRLCRAILRTAAATIGANLLLAGCARSPNVADSHLGDGGGPHAAYSNMPALAPIGVRVGKYMDRVVIKSVNALIAYWSKRLAAFDVYIWDQCYAMEQSLGID